MSNLRPALYMSLITTLIAGCGSSGGGSGPEFSAPTITSQPSSATVIAPDTATFAVAATGASPLGFQWRRGGTDIPGATSSSYTTPPTTPADTGAAYSVRVSNAAGSVTSATAVLSITAPPAGALERFTMLQAGVARSYLRYLPARLPPSAVPLVIVLHGGTEDASITASPARATAAWRDLADLEKFAVVYPDGLDNRWRDCRSDATLLPPADDTAFVAALIDRIASERAIDLQRVYVTGSSNGGMMSYRIAAELANQVAGVGAVIANVPVDPLRTCPARPAEALSVVIMNGTSDPLMPFAGGALPVSGAGTVLSATATRDYWVGVNGCSTRAIVENLPDLAPDDGSTVTRETYADCQGGHTVAFYRVNGGGHDMPSRRYLSGALRQNRDIEGANEIWGVLKNARRTR